MAVVDVKVVMNRAFIPEIVKMTNKAIGETARDLRDEIRSSVSIPYPPPSKPGNPPHMRSGGLRRAIFAKKIGQADWVVGVKKLEPGRENLGIWLELGTGQHREPFPPGSKGSITGEYASPGPGKTSMRARPFLLKKFKDRGPQIFKSKFRTASKVSSLFGGLAKLFGR